jgi:hypothetical protein
MFLPEIQICLIFLNKGVFQQNNINQFPFSVLFFNGIILLRSQLAMSLADSLAQRQGFVCVTLAAWHFTGRTGVNFPPT